MSDEFMAWVDVETTGLRPDEDHLLEVGITITNLGLEIVDSTSLVTRSQFLESEIKRMEQDPYVLDMHTKSGLLDDLKNADPHYMKFYEDQLYAFMEGFFNKGEALMCGSTVSFDRSMLYQHMPKLHDYFHYRNLDISSIKESCRRYNPELYAKLPEKKYDAHRVDDDLKNSIEEFRFYCDNFLFTTR